MSDEYASMSAACHTIPGASFCHFKGCFSPALKIYTWHFPWMSASTTTNSTALNQPPGQHITQPLCQSVSARALCQEPLQYTQPWFITYDRLPMAFRALGRRSPQHHGFNIPERLHGDLFSSSVSHFLICAIHRLITDLPCCFPFTDSHNRRWYFFLSCTESVHACVLPRIGLYSSYYTTG